jgi:predicted metal-dependent enzyme (double-stranded beta helix superfamily)
VLGRDIIHSVVNPLGKLSAAIHVYDGDFMHAHRSMWDCETLQEAPYDVNVVVKGMPMKAGEKVAS